MKPLLDEQLSQQIAVLLRQRGCDVVAVADRTDFVGRSDRVILEVASSEVRAVVTILPPSSRTRTRATVHAVADAIERMLRDHPDGLSSSERWVGPLASA